MEFYVKEPIECRLTYFNFLMYFLSKYCLCNCEGFNSQNSRVAVSSKGLSTTIKWWVTSLAESLAVNDSFTINVLPLLCTAGIWCFPFCKLLWKNISFSPIETDFMKTFVYICKLSPSSLAFLRRQDNFLRSSNSDWFSPVEIKEIYRKSGNQEIYILIFETDFSFTNP